MNGCAECGREDERLIPCGGCGGGYCLAHAAQHEQDCDGRPRDAAREIEQVTA